MVDDNDNYDEPHADFELEQQQKKQQQKELERNYKERNTNNNTAITSNDKSTEDNNNIDRINISTKQEVDLLSPSISISSMNSSYYDSNIMLEEQQELPDLEVTPVLNANSTITMPSPTVENTLYIPKEQQEEQYLDEHNGAAATTAILMYDDTTTPEPEPQQHSESPMLQDNYNEVMDDNDDIPLISATTTIHMDGQQDDNNIEQYKQQLDINAESEGLFNKDDNNVQSINNNSSTQEEQQEQQEKSSSNNNKKSPSAIAIWFKTLKALLRKNTIILLSCKIRLSIMILLPLLFFFAAYSMDQAIINSLNSSSTSTDESTITTVNACTWKNAYNLPMTSDQCITVLYTTIYNNNSSSNYPIGGTVDDIMNNFAIQNELSIEIQMVEPTGFENDIVGVVSLDQMTSFMSKYPGHIDYAILFSSNIGINDTTTDIDVMLYTNSSWYPDLDEKNMLNSLSQSSISVQLGNDKPVHVNVYASSVDQDSDNYDDKSIYDNGSYTSVDSFLALSYSIVSILLMNVIAREKQQELVGYLRSMGMPDLVYWISWNIINAILALVSSFLVVIGAYCISFVQITNVNFMIPWIIVSIGQFTMVGSAFVLIPISPSQAALNTLQFIMLISTLVGSAYASAQDYQVAPSATFLKIWQVLVPSTNFGLIFGSFLGYDSKYGEYDNMPNHYTWSTMSTILNKCSSSSSNSIEEEEENMCVMEPYIDSGSNECYNDPIPQHCYYSSTIHSDIIGILILQYSVFFILTWYLFLVIPSGNGIPRKFWFIFDYREFWLWSTKKTKSNVSSSSSSIEEEDPQRKETLDSQSLLVQNLTKEFKGGHVAVDKFNLNLSNGQIFVLLGHNGAGKTTLINMLTGKIPSTSGEAYFCGMRLSTELSSIQAMTGIVPQYDRLWSELSAYEHVNLFATMKNKGSEEYITSILEKVYLDSSKDQASGEYSGGMKRRLSIAIASVGDAKILYMDEPTTGIDPLNRRKIWKLIQDLKQDRIIVLTTHLMQEADVLGDTVAIMDSGILKVQPGTPLTLKTKYGTGYTLNICTPKKQDVQRVCDLACTSIPGVDIVNCASTSVSIGIPTNEVERLPSFALQLQNEGLIREWNVSQTTLEEVFLRLVDKKNDSNQASSETSLEKMEDDIQINLENADESHHQFSRLVEDTNNSSESTGNAESHECSPLVEKTTDSETTGIRTVDDDAKIGLSKNDKSHHEEMGEHHFEEQDVQFKPKSISQVKALSKKFWIIRKRNPIGSILQLNLPLVLVCLVVIVQHFDPPPKFSLECNLCRGYDDADCNVLCSTQITSPEYWRQIFEGNTTQIFYFEWPHLWTRDLSVSYCSNDSDTNALVWVTPLGAGLFPIDGATFLEVEPSQVQNFTEYIAASTSFYSNLNSESNLMNYDYDYSACAWPAYYIDNVKEPTPKSVCEKVTMLRKIANVAIDVNAFSDRNDTEIRFNMSATIVKEKVRGLFCDEGIEDDICPPGELLNTIDLKPRFDGYEYYDLLHSAYNLLSSNYGIRELKPLAVKEEITDYWPSVGITLPILFSVSLAIAVSVASIPVISEIISEKEDGYVFNLLLNGLNLRNYWIAFYLYHATLFLLSAMIFLVGVVIFRLRVVDDINWGYVFIVTLLYMNGQFAFTVLLSNIFKKPRLAGALMMLLIVIISLTMLSILSIDVTMLPLALDMIPLFSFIRSMFLITINYDLDSVLYGNLIMVSCSVVYCLAGIYLHGTTGKAALLHNPLACLNKLVKQNLPLHASPTHTDAYLGDTTDALNEDVKAEVIRAKSLMPSETAVKLDDLSKTFRMKGFKTMNAVTDLSMAMDYGEIFGLLGPNGAGKTTAISMVTGQLNPSQGQVFVGGFNTVEEKSNALKLLGIVPQFDVLYNDMTVKEHLEMYAQVKGVDEDQITSWSKHIACKVSLEDLDLYTRQAKQLSGGMRRRLSIGIALLSHPRVLFLDEPTTGLDPGVKRSIWDVIETMRENRCILLTTHAMDEAEALCNRIGIMAKGSLVCVGTQSQLRNRYGDSFELSFTTVLNNDPLLVDPLFVFLEKYFSNVNLVSKFGSSQVYTISRDNVDLTTLFNVILRGQSQGLYVEWGIGQSSLDEIFCAITEQSNN